MPYFFWIALAAGYVLGLVGAAFILPPEFLIPVLGYMAALTLIGTALFGVYIARRQREGVPLEGHDMTFDRLNAFMQEFIGEIATMLGATRVRKPELDLREWTPTRRQADLPAGVPSHDRERYTSLASLSAGTFDDLTLDDLGPRPVETFSSPQRTFGKKSGGRDIREIGTVDDGANRQKSRGRKSGAVISAQREGSDVSPGLENGAIETASPVMVRPRARNENSGIRCIAAPIVVVPQRRWVGLHVQGRIVTSPKRSASRDQLVRHRIPKEQLLRFDAAILERAVAMMETHAADLIDREVVVETSMTALLEGNILRRLEQLAGDPLTGSVHLVLAVDLAEARKILPKLKNIPANLKVAVSIDEPQSVDVRWIAGQKVSQVAMGGAQLCGRSDVPLANDPLYHQITALSEAGVSVLALGIEEESDLLDVLDYPVSRAAGQLFGRRAVIMSDGSCTFFTFDERAPLPERKPAAKRQAVTLDIE
ncbi:MAG: hypothetical protein R3D03_22520 [Geminicoccaceae bacterium]